MDDTLRNNYYYSLTENCVKYSYKILNKLLQKHTNTECMVIGVHHVNIFEMFKKKIKLANEN